MTSLMQKQLVEFLQEQQEPFTLELYLLERRQKSRKNRLHSSEGGSRKSKPCLKRSVSRDLKRTRNFIPNCSKIVRALFSKLLTVKNSQKLQKSKIKLGNYGDSRKDKGRQGIADEDNFSSASSTTVFNSCSESDVEDAHHSSKNSKILLTADHQEPSKDEHGFPENEAAAGWKFRWKGTEDNKQLSPISVLEETESYNSSPSENEARRKQKQFLEKVSKCKSERPIHKRTQDLISSNSIASSHYSKNKKAVQQTRRLLFDCVREVVVEKHKKESGDHKFEGIMGAEQLWELICENLSIWSKESINEANIINLVHSDMSFSAHEWSHFEKQTQETSFQLGDAILEEISNEIITEMTSFCRDK